jgi:uncharacterized membrane protein
LLFPKGGYTMILFYTLLVIFLLVMFGLVVVAVVKGSQNHASKNQSLAKKGSGDGSYYSGGDTSDWSSGDASGSGGGGE